MKILSFLSTKSHVPNLCAFYSFQDNMVRPKKQIIWKHFRETENKSVTCKYCELKYKIASTEKMARHLLKCPNCPELYKQELNANKTQTPLESSVTLSDTTLQHCNQENMRPESQLTSPIDSGVGVNDINLTKDNLHSLLAMAIFVSGTPLSIVEHPLWTKFFKELQPSYKLPTRKTISTTMLDKAYKEMHQDLKETVLSQTCLHLMLDGWSNCRNEGIINILIAKPEPVFIKSIATAENRHTSEYYCKEILSVLSEYRSSKFVTMIGDNASNIQKAFRLVKNVHTNLTYLNCAAHTLNLLCKDIVKIDVINASKDMALNIIKTIRKSQILTSLLAKIVKEKNAGETLKMPCDTRWGSYYLSFKSILNSKLALQTLAVHERASILSAEDKSTLLDDMFWEIIQQCSLIMKPITDTIFELEGNDNRIHKVFLSLKNMKSKLLFILPDVTIIENRIKDEILKNSNERIKMCLKPIHFAAYLLDPTTRGEELNENEEIEAMEYICHAGENIGLNVMPNLAAYRTKDGFWSKRFLWNRLNDITVLAWWKGICSSTALSKVAVRILTAPCTSAAVERSFSAHSNVHSKKRNRLTTERAAKLTFIAYNWNIMHKQINENSNQTENYIIELSPERNVEPTFITSPEPSTSTAGMRNFEFLNCDRISDESGDDS